ncbi:MAG: hypothetical protein KGZ49_13130 [Syntrophaceae bacterium]|nr:hypothetical protein [Syntrophaceae bacterium]
MNYYKELVSCPHRPLPKSILRFDKPVLSEPEALLSRRLGRSLSRRLIKPFTLREPQGERRVEV